jgi:hypothetical protein
VIYKEDVLGILESHQRQLVDGSDPAYKEDVLKDVGIPPTAVGGWFRSNLSIHRKSLHGICRLLRRPDLNNPPTAVGGISE